VASTLFLSGPRRSCDEEPGEADEVVCGCGEGEGEADAVEAAELGLSEAGGGLGPAEELLDPFSEPLDASKYLAKSAL